MSQKMARSSFHTPRQQHYSFAHQAPEDIPLPPTIEQGLAKIALTFLEEGRADYAALIAEFEALLGSEAFFDQVADYLPAIIAAEEAKRSKEAPQPIAEAEAAEEAPSSPVMEGLPAYQKGGKDEITQNTSYRWGRISQQCEKCQWEASRLSIEYQVCPSCGMTIFENAILKFGGLTIEYEANNRFFLRTPHTDSIVEVDAADVRDTIAYLLKHFQPTE